MGHEGSDKTSTRSILIRRILLLVVLALALGAEQSHISTSFAARSDSNSSPVSDRSSTLKQNAPHPKDPSRKVKLNRHSFSSPLTKDTSPDNTFEWSFDGASAPNKKHVVLVPAVFDRIGSFWHKNPLLTSQFQIIFSFIIQPTKRRQLYPNGFAFWFTPEKYEPSSNETKSLLGFRGKPSGLGVFFAIYDVDGKYHPSISAAYFGNSTEDTEIKIELPTKAGAYHDFVSSLTRNNGEGIFQLIADSSGVSGMVLNKNGEWVDLFFLKDVQLHSSGYIGFTAASMSQENTKTKKEADLISIGISSLITYNLDMRIMQAEYDPDIITAVKDFNMEELIRTEDQLPPSENIAASLLQLSRIVYQQISDQASRESQILRITRSMLLKMQHLEATLSEVKSLIEQNDPGGKISLSNIDSVYSELTNMKALLNKHSKQHALELSAIHSKMDENAGGEILTKEELKRLAENAELLHTSMSSKHSISTGMTLFLIFLLIIFALLMWKKFRDFEKKHYF